MPIRQHAAEFLELANFIKAHAKQKPVIYVPNFGNWGDGLIRYGEHRFFEDFNIRYQEIQGNDALRSWRKLVLGIRRLNNLLIYGGGGAWCNNFSSGLRYVSKFASHFNTVIVLPSSYELGGTEIPSENVFFYSRDRFESMQTMPKSRFCHDMAFYLGTMATPPGAGEGVFFRTDCESANRINIPDNNVDISLQGDHLTDPKRFIDSIAAYESVRTDRLHVGIAATLLNRKLTLFEGNYFKNRAVFDSSIRDYFQNSKLAF